MTEKACNGRLNNCGPIKESDNYCLFHKPKKTESEAIIFYGKIIEQASFFTPGHGRKQIIFGPNINWAGYVFPICEHKTDLIKHDILSELRLDRIFTEAIFIGRVDFSSAVFECRADFRGSSFSNLVDFSYATFCSEVDLSWITIVGEARFEEIKAEGKFDLYNGTFNRAADFGDSTFNSYFSCKKTIFNGEVYFGQASFNRYASFQEVNYIKDTDFSDSSFRGVSDFNKSVFSAEADFQGVHFMSNASYEKTVFKGETIFQETTFDCEASFNEATFEEKVIFDWATFKAYTDFSGNDFIKEVSFTGVLFGRTCNFKDRRFHEKLYFTYANFLHGILMESDWKKPEQDKYKLPQAEIEGCRVQRLSYEKEGNREASDHLFVREMRAKRKMRDKYIRNLIETIFIDKTCEYGTRWQLLIKTSAYVILIFALVYLISYANIPHIGSIGQPHFYYLTTEFYFKSFIDFISILFESIYYSLVVFTTLGNGAMQPTGIMRFIVGIESLLGAFFLALFVVVFARKWMR